ncbi:hypothetical protein GCM10027055_18650 [Janibacter alkaliphilus]
MAMSGAYRQRAGGCGEVGRASSAAGENLSFPGEAFSGERAFIGLPDKGEAGEVWCGMCGEGGQGPTVGG